ncbi:hypothetical protein C3Y87_11535 [Carbonactinospora thermoautotrophica]|uniref:ABC transporter substrate-binding protein n=1 Tax=Carbonactinospora thermoautotrophica TaxID=1469144 RepID=UPI00226DC282|nr:ABC transporter substrate-binding protein [Carbonactinospora thermoautotrophica]MCX9192034.1 hypothetical protein [Carbonactinospora thermoautotrophica]
MNTPGGSRAARRFKRLLTLWTALSLLVAACAQGDVDRAGGPPRRGGTLRMIGAGDVDGMDTAVGYTAAANTLFRAVTRQLVAYPAAADPKTRSRPVPDLAEAIPTPTDGGRTYEFRIRAGARWDTSPPRQITAADVARGFKRLCNPTGRRFGALGYYVGVIAGMDEFCAKFAKVTPAVEEIREFVEGHEIPGVEVVDERTVRFHLTRRAGDFLNILALPASSPVPVEALDHLPDSPEYRAHVISSGPYKIARYEPKKLIHLVRNPAWDPATDQVRKAWVDEIRIDQGYDETPVLRKLESGEADMSWDTFVPPRDISRLQEKQDPKLSSEDDGSLNPYLVINLRSPTAGHALGRLAVRQALNFAVDKQAIMWVCGGPAQVQPHSQILTPPLDGYQQYDLYPTPGNRGDPEQARDLLAQAGYPNGLTLTFLYRDSGKHPAVARQLQADLARAGIRLRLKAVDPDDFYNRYLRDPESGKAGEWDLAAPSWAPDWPGNAARSFFVPLLDGRRYGPGSVNYGGYDSPEVNRLIDEALQTSSPDQAADIWARADRLVMQDAPWVPLLTGRIVNYRAERVRNWVYLPLLKNGDPTNVWLAG